eukprot:s5543_g6.t1
MKCSQPWGRVEQSQSFPAPALAEERPRQGGPKVALGLRRRLLGGGEVQTAPRPPPRAALGAAPDAPLALAIALIPWWCTSHRSSQVARASGGAGLKKHRKISRHRAVTSGSSPRWPPKTQGSERQQLGGFGGGPANRAQRRPKSSHKSPGKVDVTNVAVASRTRSGAGQFRGSEEQARFFEAQAAIPVEVSPAPDVEELGESWGNVLHERLEQNLVSQGLLRPTASQSWAVPLLLNGKDAWFAGMLAQPSECLLL